MEHKKYLQDNILLTKESFNLYTKHLREERAKEYGLTLEQWDEAVRTGATILPIIPNSNTTTTQ
jgi:hypothetical protein